MTYTPPEVRYLDDNAGGRTADPELDQKWSDLKKLRWNAAFVELETGIKLRVGHARYSVGGIPRFGYFSINANAGHIASASGPYTFDDAWTYLRGIQAGAEYAKALPHD